MPAAKRRKTSQPAPRVAAAKGITAFTKVSKATIITSEKQLDKVATISTSITGQKRKAVEDLECNDGIDASEVSAILSAAANSTANDHDRELSSLQTPRTPQKQRAISASPHTPTKGARALLDRFFLSTPTLTPKSKKQLEPKEVQPPSTVPREIEDLLGLHIALLSTLSIQYAHNGVDTPVDTRVLYQNVARAWGRRSVTAIDVRRSLGIQNHVRDDTLAHLTLSDYGHGKICIEVSTMGKEGRLGPPLDEDAMNDVFAENLAELWRKADCPTTPTDVTTFTCSLPQEQITVCDSLIKLSPLLAKGRARLNDIKSPSASPSARSVASSPSEPVTPTPSRYTCLPNPQLPSKGPSLLERLRAKSKLAASQPPPPSTAELSRRAALHRLDDIVPMVVVLSTSTSRGQSRISFTMTTVTSKIVGSARTPIGPSEAQRCVKALAEEIAPEWLKIVTLRPAKVGKGKSATANEMVVVEREKFPGTEEIRARIHKALSSSV